MGNSDFLPGSKPGYVGEHKDGKKHGKGNLTYADGSKYEGEWKNGKFVE